MLKLFLVDPMSYNNLSLYDKLLLTNINAQNKYLFGNIKYEYKCNSSFDCHLIYKYSERKGYRKVLSYSISQILLLYYFIKYKPNVVHFQWFKFPSFDIWIIKIIKLLNSKVKVVFTAHNTLPHNSENKYLNVYSAIYEIVDKIIVHESTAKETIIELFKLSPDKINIIPHGLLFSNTDWGKIKAENNNVITFAMLGFLSNYKGIDLLIDAWADSELLSNNKNIRLIIAGKTNPDIKEKLAKIRNKINVKIIDRFLSDDEFNDLIDISNLVILPYKIISQSGLLMTVLAHRKAVLVSNIGGLTQPFQVGKVGWILNELTSNELMDKLEYISNNINEIKKIEEDNNLWSKINDFYSWIRIGALTLNTYNN